MVINGISVDQYHARQHKVTYGYPERDMSCEWPTGGPNPTFYRNLPGFETVGIEIMGQSFFLCDTSAADPAA